ncbi:chitin synthase-domain-containing protein [Paraphysoderma sedebokerense]|nr:chitin synthase-domain-containing protein [Paraphysoderma sedebokerense]KAI9142609.1 chitin synthase-domain-containing protein [Paraphysoderma sedebokerense]
MKRYIFDPISGETIPNTLANFYYPYWLLVILQILFWVLVVLFLLYLTSHYVVHSWCFFEIARLGLKEIATSKAEQKLEDKWGSYDEQSELSGNSNSKKRINIPPYYQSASKKLTDAKWRVLLAIVNWLVYTGCLIMLAVLNFVFLASGYTAAGWVDISVSFAPDPMKWRSDYGLIFYAVNAGPPIVIGLIALFKFLKDTIRHRLFVRSRRKNADTLPPPVSSADNPAKVDEDPTVIILIPTYKEPLPNILSTLNAITASEYPKEKIHIYLGFDDLEVQQTVFTLTRLLSGEGILEEADQLHQDEKSNKYNGLVQLQSKRSTLNVNAEMNTQDPHSPQPVSVIMSADHCPLVTSLIYNDTSLHLCRFPHGGKLSVQKHLFSLISKRIPQIYPGDSYVLFIDSDTTVLPNTVRNFVDHLTINPKELATTGIIVSRNGHSTNFWQQYQDAEYIFMQLGSRCTEAAMGGVTCLPGALTMVYYPLLKAVSAQYFNQPPIDSTFEFCRRKLGEDRYLTHLIMEYTGSYRVGFDVNSICKTEAPGNFYNLLRQRRRWTLGSFTNEVYILCTPRFYFSYPFLILLRVYQTLRLSGVIFYIFLLEMFFTAELSDLKPALYVVNFAVFFLYWLILAVWAIFNKRWKSMIWVWVYFIGNLIFESVWLWYSIWTVREKSVRIKLF